MNLKKIELDELSKKVDPIVAMRNNWYLITAEHDGTVNALTGGWGTFGNLWEKKVATVYIRPQRYTKKFMDASGKFTLTFFEGHQKEMGFIGSNSGKDVPDKIGKSGLHLTSVEGQPTYEEGKIVVLCKTIYTQQIQPENFIEKGFGEQTYPDKDYSVVYVAEILAAYESNE